MIFVSETTQANLGMLSLPPPSPNSQPIDCFLCLAKLRHKKTIKSGQNFQIFSFQESIPFFRLSQDLPHSMQLSIVNLFVMQIILVPKIWWVHFFGFYLMQFSSIYSISRCISVAKPITYRLQTIWCNNKNSLKYKTKIKHRKNCECCPFHSLFKGHYE